MKQKIFFSVDAHGATSIWKKWMQVSEIYNVDTLMLCGDLTGKVLVPIISTGNRIFKATYFGKNWTLETERELLKLEENLADAGAYSIRCTQDDIEMLKNDHKRVEQTIEKRIKDRVKEWLELLIDKLHSSRLKVIIMPGNDDSYSIDPIIKSYSGNNIIYPLDKVVKIGDIEIISLAHVNPTPWSTPREANETRLSKMIENSVKRLYNPDKAIFNFHAPPYGTRIDLAPELNRNKKPVIIAGQINYIHAGSTSVKKAIEEYQPLLGLHGHIHESSGIEKIGNTVCINPGSEYSEGILRGYIVEFANSRLKNYWKVEG